MWVCVQDEVRKQDAVFGIVSVAVNPVGRDLAWQYFQDNSAQLLTQYEVSDSIYNRRFLNATIS